MLVYAAGLVIAAPKFMRQNPASSARGRKRVGMLSALCVADTVPPVPCGQAAHNYCVHLA